MLDNNVSRFCELVLEINERNNKLKKERYNFYDGGHSFEDCYSSDIKELAELQAELKTILPMIQMSM